jgi:hypothetical protein
LLSGETLWEIFRCLWGFSDFIEDV